MNRNSLKQHLVEGRSHMTSHYTGGPVTTLHDFGRALGWPLATSLDISTHYPKGLASSAPQVTTYSLY